MTAVLEISCRDPIIARDGRPFGAGQSNRMRSVDWLLPSVIAGAVRTTIGNLAGRDFPEIVQDLLDVEVAGPFPRRDETIYFPAPEDCAAHPTQGPLRASPRAIDGGGCDWPATGLQPVMTDIAEDFKPMDAPAWWPGERLAAWLAGEKIAFDDSFLRSAEKEDRTHASIASDVGVAADSRLFTTSALALTALRKHGDLASTSRRSRFAPIALTVRVRAAGWCAETTANLDALHTLGGERRLVHSKSTQETSDWTCPKKIRNALAGASRIRMALATPAIFRDGWKPGWLNDDLVGTPPGSNVVVRLAGAATRRWRAVSGWSLAEPRGPKPVRRLAPAGGVYFFELVEGSAPQLADHWLEPVSDDAQHRRDGFGLALWGVW